MVELYKLLIERPIHGVVAALVVVVVLHATRIMTVEKAYAALEVRQSVDEQYNQEQKVLVETIIRIDENVKFMKAHLDKS